MKLVYDSCSSPIGLLHLVVDEIGLKRVFILPEHWEKYLIAEGDIPRDTKACEAYVRELEDYFCGKLHKFSIPLSVDGTAFYKQVWNELISIPYGEVRTYSQIASAVGNPKSCRAVGQANRNNPLPVVIPCHRVVGKNGSMTGYLGNNPDIKYKLLLMEKQFKT